MEQYLIIALILFTGSLIQGLAGFGFALTVTPLLSLMMPLRELVPLITLCGTVINLVLFIYMRKSFSLKRIIPLVMGSIPGIPLGVFLLTQVNEQYIKYLLACILMTYSILSLTGVLQPGGLSRSWGYFFGFLSGVLGGAINSNGPPVIIYSSLNKWDSDTIKVTLQSFFLSSGIMIIASHYFSGILTAKIAQKSLMALPVILGGIYAGMFFYKKIDQVFFRRLVLLMLILLSLMLLFV